MGSSLFPPHMYRFINWNRFLEYFDLSFLHSKLERSLARRLAAMHDPANPASTPPNGMYGFDVPTHCGETEQARLSCAPFLQPRAIL
jgi:hypothetical protein